MLLNRHHRLILAVGANIPGPWGAPYDTISSALSELGEHGVELVAGSSVYKTNPVGNVMQRPYLNGVVVARTAMTPYDLMSLCKRIEWQAGRRCGRRNGPRPLDLDILDLGGRVINRPATRSRSRSRVILPHPEMAARAFVLLPLREVCPSWRHPRTNLSIAAMLRAGQTECLQRLGREIVRLDLRWPPCHKQCPGFKTMSGHVEPQLRV